MTKGSFWWSIGQLAGIFGRKSATEIQKFEKILRENSKILYFYMSEYQKTISLVELVLKKWVQMWF